MPENPLPPPTPQAKPPPPAQPSQVAAPPQRTPDPSPNPLPPPELPKRPPGRPKKPAHPHLQPVNPPAPGQPQAPPAKVLPADPAAREALISPHRSEAEQLVRFADAMLSSYLPPPLADPEIRVLTEPVAQLLWKYDGHLPPELMLLAAVAGIYGPRYKAAKERQAAAGKKAA